MADEEYQNEDEEVLVTDQIERTITVPVSTERVWTALTTEEGMSFHAVIEAVEPYTRFAFR